MAVYGYIRTSKSIESGGKSHDSQREAIESCAAKHSLEIDSMISDRSVSGFIPLEKRPMGAKLIGPLKSEDIIIVSTFDRLFRGILDARDTLRKLEKKKVRILIAREDIEITSEDNRKVSKALIDAFAAFEAKELGERIREAKQSLREKGRYVGGKVDFGYRLTDDGRLVKDNEGQEAIRLMKKLRKEGASYRSISEEIKRTYKGQLKISHEGVRAILNRESEKKSKK